MATIGRNKLLTDAALYLPPYNSLTDAEMLIVAEQVIARVGDDDTFYAEILCKFLGDVADINHSKTLVSSGGVKRQKVRGHEKEFFEGAGNVWKDYKDSLRDICPMFGYSPVYTIGAKINSGEIYNKSSVISSCSYPIDM